MTYAPLRILSLLVGVAGLLALSGCGGSDNASKKVASITSSSVPGDSTESSEPPLDFTEAMFEHAKCMREHGVDFPDPTVEVLPDGGEFVAGGEAADPYSPAYEAASKTCDPIIEAVDDSFERSPEEEARQRDAELVYAQCMRDHGLEWPDPIFGADGETSFPEGFKPNYDDPAIQELDLVCGEEAYGPMPPDADT